MHGQAFNFPKTAASYRNTCNNNNPAILIFTHIIMKLATMLVLHASMHISIQFLGVHKQMMCI